MTQRLSTVGLITPTSLFPEIRNHLAGADVEWDTEVLGTKLTLLHPAAAKGLEFDGVVVVEPSAIVAEELHGHRMLYIALTRAVQELAVVHSLALPAELEPDESWVTRGNRAALDATVSGAVPTGS